MPVAGSIIKEGNKHCDSLGEIIETVTYYRHLSIAVIVACSAAYCSIHYLKSKIVTQLCASSGLFDH